MFKFLIPRKTQTFIDARMLQCVIADSPALATDVQLVDLSDSPMASFTSLTPKKSFSSVNSAHDRNPLYSDQLTGGGVVRPSQVVQVRITTVWLLIASQTLVLLPAYNPALMRDCLDIVLVLMTRLVKGVLCRKHRHSIVMFIKNLNFILCTSIFLTKVSLIELQHTLPSRCLLPSLVSSGW